jgi:hypothetical protein
MWCTELDDLSLLEGSELAGCSCILCFSSFLPRPLVWQILPARALLCSPLGFPCGLVVCMYGPRELFVQNNLADQRLKR